MKLYQDGETGSIYTVENGKLIQHPLYSFEGMIDTKNGAVVDWNDAATEPSENDKDGRGLYAHLKNIEKMLLEK